MGIEVKLAFDLLAFISVMVLIVLGLGIIASMMGIFNFAHGEFVLLGAYTVYLFESSGLSAWAGIIAAPVVLALVGLVLERLIIRRFYAAPIIAMLGTYAIGLVIREIVRGLLGGHYKSISEPLPGLSFGRPLQVDLGTLARRVHFVRRRLLGLARRDRAHHDLHHRSHLAIPVAHVGRTAGPRLAREPQPRARLRDFDESALRHDLCLRRGAGGPRRRADRAALPALGRHRHALPGAGLPVGHAGRRRYIRGTGAGGGGRRRHGSGAALAGHSGARRSA